MVLGGGGDFLTVRKTSLLLLPLSLTSLLADVTLPPLISDNMLLQRSKAAVWGKADPGEHVTVKLGAATAKATADKDGKWQVKLDGLKTGEPAELLVSGNNKLTIKNVAVGDVWVCSGQSNMEMTVASGAWCGYGGVVNVEQEVAMADSPAIRMFTVLKKSSETPVDEVQGKWEICSPETVAKWSATGYFFGRQLHDDLGVPIGLITTAWGGTTAQAWTPSGVLQGDPDFKATYYDRWQAQLANYPAALETYEKKTLPAWQAAADQAKAAGQPIPRKPGAPSGPGTGGSPSALYNGMIVGVTKYAVKGAIWYQGESNASDAVRYRKLLPAMITSWRKDWGTDLPFLIVQLASFGQPVTEPADCFWAELREAQTLTSLTVPNTGMAVAIDIGDPTNIHPKNKQEVGRRLALVAESNVYHKAVTASGPALDDAKFENGAVKIRFKPGTAVGLATKDGAAVKGFAVAGEDRKFVWAEAQIVGGDAVDHTGTLDAKKAGKGKKAEKAPAEPVLVLSSPAVVKPVAVRYAWANTPEVNLINKSGLPACPFRTDDWPQNPPAPVKPSPSPTPAIPSAATPSSK